MALGLLYTRRCEQRFKAYVPKRRLFRYLTGQHVDWGCIDQHDEERGEYRARGGEARAHSADRMACTTARTARSAYRGCARMSTLRRAAA